MTQAFICDAVRTPFGRYGGALAGVRADDLGAVPIRALMQRNSGVDWAAVTDVLYGCANQAGCSRACPSTCPAPPSTACAARAWTPWVRPRAPSRPARPA